MGVWRTDLTELRGVCCERCGRPPELWCEDCGCPVSCHEFIYPKYADRLPYCLRDFGPCSKERRPVFLTALEALLREMRQHLPKQRQAA